MLYIKFSLYLPSVVGSFWSIESGYSVMQVSSVKWFGENQCFKGYEGLILDFEA